jgi:hypothetical protein
MLERSTQSSRASFIRGGGGESREELESVCGVVLARELKNV